MPALPQEIHEVNLEYVRQALVLNPRATVGEVKSLLEARPKFPVFLSEKYIGKLIRKVKVERFHRYDHDSVNRRLAEIEDITQAVAGEMWKIFLDPLADKKARVMAGKTIIDSHHKFLESQMNAGVFTRQLGTIDVEHQHEHTLTVNLPPEIEDSVMRALENHGIIKPKYRVLNSAPVPASTA